MLSDRCTIHCGYHPDQVGGSAADVHCGGCHDRGPGWPRCDQPAEPPDVILDMGTRVRLPSRVPVLGSDDQPIGTATLQAVIEDQDGTAIASYRFHLDP